MDNISLSLECILTCWANLEQNVKSKWNAHDVILLFMIYQIQSAVFGHVKDTYAVMSFHVDAS